MSRMYPCLWFPHEAEEAAAFYVSLLPDSRIEEVQRVPADGPAGPAGGVLVVRFTLDGSPWIALNGRPPAIAFNHAVSVTIECDDQAEVDRLWAALTADGGAPVQCGWLTDRYGVSWQIVPKMLPPLISDPDRARATRVFEAMQDMVKLDIAALEAAAAG
ncbi:VOC family protein [Caenispirillum bisanense]|uniref:Glyoxalase superfamily enzyme, possibly 3-demethylubiquinone-9 3-methyltransferase n=1 Tax=Caenispirillum bisanense TaxID=414052 RepID=A0A286G6F8_9PROT|nr:VOC family protein [Caenispirillum bisanense]SOD91093.1 Glyoxalase superfamily enzyme, possibly 3-demethylubiquinone-9 3-methyltransferase [Caenispirillum bisanense]